jgi:hypothetical protein
VPAMTAFLPIVDCHKVSVGPADRARVSIATDATLDLSSPEGKEMTSLVLIANGYTELHAVEPVGVLRSGG